jgi:hypothetical protein
MRTSVLLPAFLVTRGEATSPSYALRAALAERLAGQRMPTGETGTSRPCPIPANEPEARAIPVSAA